MIAGGTRISRYEILSHLASGGMGDIYRASDAALHRFVAIKVMPPELVNEPERVRRFVQEAQAASALNHPNILHIYDVGQATVDGQTCHFIAMELVEGETLRSRLVKRPAPDEVVHWLVQVTAGLAKAHSAGVIHRDLKPENIMVSADGHAKILDFGLAKLVEPESPDAAAEEQLPTRPLVTRAGQILGTPAYMSPEQVEGRGVDHRSDIFSFGCILFECLTERRPFEGRSAVDVMQRVLHEEHDSTAVPADYRSIVQKCLQKDPGRRYQSTRDLLVDLQAVATHRRTDGTVRAGRPRVSAVAVSAMALLTLFSAVAVWRLRKSDAPPGIGSSSRVAQITFRGDVVDGAISPDGRYVAFIANAEGKSQIFIRTRGSSAESLLVPPSPTDYLSVAFGPGDGLLYFRQADRHDRSLIHLMRVPVIGGAPVQVVSGVDTRPAFSSDGSRFAFGRLVKGGTHIVLFDLARKREQILTRADGMTVRSLAWSPDHRIAASTFTESDGNRLVTIEVGAGKITPVRAGMFGVYGWSPDSSAILVTANASALNHQIFRIPVSSGADSPLTSDTNSYSRLSMTRDGRRMTAVASRMSYSVWTVFRGQTKQLTPLRVGRRDGIGLDWGPDETLIYNSFAAEAEVWSTRFDGSDTRRVIGFPFERGRAVIWEPPAVSPLGGRAVVTTPEARMILVDLTTGIFIEMNDASGRHFHWSPDGRSVYYTAMTPLPNDLFRDGGIHVFDVETRTGRPFTWRGAPLASQCYPVGVTANALYVAGNRECFNRDGKLLKLTLADQSLSEVPMPESIPAGSRLHDRGRAICYRGTDGNIWLYRFGERSPSRLTDIPPFEPIVTFAMSSQGRLAYTTRSARANDLVEIALDDAAAEN